MGDLEPLDPVAPAVSCLQSCSISCHQSRSGPAVEFGGRVSQHPRSGKYASIRNNSLPDQLPCSSLTSRAADSFPRLNGCLIPCRKQDVVIFYQNAGGMNSDVEEYRLAVSDRSYDVIVLCETWLDSRTLSSQVFGPDYEVFRCDRNPNNSRKSTGGGVLIAVRRGLETRAIENDSWNSVEQIWTAINLGDRILFLCALYIAPDRVRDSELIDTHCRSVFSVMDSANPVDEIFIFGDFNLPGVSWKPAHSGFLYPDPDISTFHAGAISLLDNYSAATLSQINHVVNENNRTLDLCFVSTQDKAPFISTAPCPLIKPVPHHPPLIVTVEDKLVRDFDEFPTAVSYDFRKADHRSIIDVLSNMDWENILDSDDIEAAAQTFSHVLAYVIDRHVPKRIHHKAIHPPWQSSELRKLKSIKRAALKKIHEVSDASSETSLCEAQSHVPASQSSMLFTFSTRHPAQT